MQKVIVVDDFLDQEDVKTCIGYATNGLENRIILDSYFSTYIWGKYGSKLTTLNPEWTGLYDEVTLSNCKIPVKKHLDQNRNDAKHKLLIYLNDVPDGGTIFYLKDETIVVNNKANRLVCFDISLYHQSQHFRGIRKLAIGFRPKI